MSFIRCPYCQSTQVRQTDSGNAHANYFEQLQRCISPTQMAMFGMQVARKSGFSPLFGAAVGVVVGGVLVVVSQYTFEKYYSNAEQYHVWIANKRLHGCRNRISNFTRLHL